MMRQGKRFGSNEEAIAEIEVQNKSFSNFYQKTNTTKVKKY